MDNLLRPEVLVFLIPIVAIVGGIYSSMVKMKYKHEERMALNQSAEGHEAEIESLSRIADILDQRTQVLEDILDDEVPEWRTTHDRK